MSTANSFRRFRAADCGLATLEAAMILIAITTVSLGALALVDYLNRTDAAYRSIDRHIHNSNVKATKIVRNPNTGGFSLEVDEAAIRVFIDRIAEQAIGSSIEAAYAVADIDEHSGALLGLRPPSYRTVRGEARPRESAGCPGVESELMRFAGNAGVPSILAVPDAGTSQTPFLTIAVVVIARSEIDFTDAPITGPAISLWGMTPRITLCSIAPLRGEVSSDEG